MMFCYPYGVKLYDDAMRCYAADLFNWCAARRDYPYAQHAEPDAAPWLSDGLRWEIRERVLREWARSNYAQS